MFDACRAAGRDGSAGADSSMAQTSEFQTATHGRIGGHGVSRTGFRGSHPAVGIRSAFAGVASPETAGLDWGGVAAHGPVWQESAKTEMDRALLCVVERPGGAAANTPSWDQSRGLELRFRGGVPSTPRRRETLPPPHATTPAS